jgi:hypothetical protein
MNSFKRNVALAFGFAFAAAHGSPAAAQLGGNPSDAFSCYSDCGVRSGTSSAGCACDGGCNVRGNCCADYNLYCATTAAAPACSLTTNNVSSHSSMFCGTDLGFVVQHGSRLEVLFGDSWEWDPLTLYTTCNTVGALGASDDAQGWLPVTRPPSTQVPFRAASIPATGISDCNSTILTLDTNDPPGAPPRTYTKIRLFTESGTELQLLPGSTPLAAFSDGTNMWAMFKANGPGTNDPEPGRTYLAWRHTAARTDYRVRQDLGSNLGDANLFLNPSATRITSYDATNPKLSNFALPTGTNAGVLLIFGRKKFWTGPSSNPDAADDNGMYLVRQDVRISTSGTKNWNPQYLTGIDFMTGKPTWSSDKNAAWAMLTTDGPTSGDFKAVNEIDVKWVPELRKWIMLYGGDVHWTLESSPPTTDQPRHGAIHMRMADYPWGPWSPPTPLLFREKMRGYFECDATQSTTPDGCDPTSYPLGTWESNSSAHGFFNKNIAGCTTALSEPVQPNTLFFNNPWLTDCFINDQPVYDQRGILYAPELIPTWTNEGTQNIFGNLLKTVTLYFLVSTWMPYQVVLAAADLDVPITTYSQGLKFVQLRDYQNKFLTAGSTLPPPVSNTVNNTTAWWVQLVDGTTPNRPMQIGDLVYFRSLSDSGLTYLSRSGDNVRFDKPGAALEERHKWRIDTVDPVRYPVGMAIEVGKTPLLIKDTGTRRLKSKVTSAGQPNIVRNLVGGGSDGVWTMTWHCQSGDNCP